MQYATDAEIYDLQYSEQYAEYIMNNCRGERMICNGDMLTIAQEEGYLFDDFLDSLGLMAS
jgi:hypothetical protein